MHGDTCYGCSGTGRAFANNKVGAIVLEYRAAVKAQRETLAQRLAPGQQVYVSGGQLSYRKDGNGEFVEVFDVTITDWKAWSGKSNGVVTSWQVAVTLVDGRVFKTSGATVLRTFMDGVDAVPYMRRCADALGKTSRTAARADYEAALVDAGWDLA